MTHNGNIFSVVKRKHGSKGKLRFQMAVTAIIFSLSSRLFINKGEISTFKISIQERKIAVEV